MRGWGIQKNWFIRFDHHNFTVQTVFTKVAQETLVLGFDEYVLIGAPNLIDILYYDDIDIFCITNDVLNYPIVDI